MEIYTYNTDNRKKSLDRPCIDNMEIPIYRLHMLYIPINILLQIPTPTHLCFKNHLKTHVFNRLTSVELQKGKLVETILFKCLDD
jgi:hypothetical protein